ncbi:hypothetical protein CASFOL_010212 [Castilleja foliolosa]|uniref:F-box domain-containing protein n=1 Tax=Castilleja foliolosa TaxID=1961234 RepID=A0ABD3DU67_9LAMI
MAAGEGESQFPEPIIQLLQSFLDCGEAARTATVSKSWHSAWLTRPNLDLDDIYFIRSHNQNDDFKQLAKKTIKRYEQSNLKIESFNLCMGMSQYGPAGALANNLIVKALKLGATRLYLRLRNDFNMNTFVLPNEVFGADNLVELSLSKCRIKLDDGVVIKCRSLESLSLEDVHGITIDTVSKIVSSCPSIEKLSLLPNICRFYYAYANLWHDVYEGLVEERGQSVDAAATATEVAVGVVDNLIPRLRCLVLIYVWFKALCLGDLLSRFSFLEDFTLYLKCSSRYDTNLEEEIQISNSSLERIKLVVRSVKRYDEVRRPRIKFDVLNVRKLTLESTVIVRVINNIL